MTTAEQFIILAGFALFVVAVITLTAVIPAVKRDDIDGASEGVTYDRARAAAIALHAPVVTRPPVTADDIADVLYVDEWEQTLTTGGVG